MHSLICPRQRFDDMFPEMVRRFMRPAAIDVDAPGEMRVDLTETDKDDHRSRPRSRAS